MITSISTMSQRSQASTLLLLMCLLSALNPCTTAYSSTLKALLQGFTRGPTMVPKSKTAQATLFLKSASKIVASTKSSSREVCRIDAIISKLKSLAANSSNVDGNGPKGV
ncbi:hypothetical protein JZ751_013700 [Albula glossodonta]|uniref:Uncharacterized protein n=1 Tax=Albula glossodonta TaxID=121402 RepID=A0A8T2NTQ1_9TELE|nr:hypothetical protein JZ751_013700 [Albula glossodonta]